MLKHVSNTLLLVAVVCSAACGNGSSNNNGSSFPPPTKKPGMTWYKDVLPIVQDHCQGCHTTGGIAPFPLLTYEDGQAVAPLMAQATQERIMPPWMPSQNCQNFKDARVLTQDQVDTIFSWNDDLAPAGNPSDAPPPPAPLMGLSPVDRMLDAGASYTPNGALSDDYHCFVLNPALTADQTLVAYDIVPGVRSQVHHVLVYSGSLAQAQNLDGMTPELGYTCFGGPGIDSPQLVAAWVPGTPPTLFPAETGIPLKAGSGLVMQIHYNLANGAPQADRSQLNLQFATGPILRPAIITPLADMQFNIPAMSTGYTDSNSLKVPANLTLWGLAPHMHLLGQRTVINALAPGATSPQCLIDIPHWDFHWQQLYFYASPTGIPLAAGTQVTLTCTWNNPGPASVTWGEGTADEMCLNFFYVTR